MASTQSYPRSDPPFDGDAAPSAAKDHFTDVEEALTRLVHANYPPDAGVRGLASNRSVNARISQSFAAATARVAIALCLGAAAIWAWRSYGSPTNSAPPPMQAALQDASIAQPATTAPNDPGPDSAERQQLEMNDIAALRQTVEQLTAGQERLTREVTKLQAEMLQTDKSLAEKPDKPMPGRLSAGPAPPVTAPARKPTAMTPMPMQAARRVSTVGPLSPPSLPVPQIRSLAQLSNVPPLRPPMPVPQR
jgi:hypothetical protein